jgi:hypothetical protein
MNRVRAQPSPEQWEQLRHALLGESDALVARIRDAIRAAIPGYRVVGDESLQDGIRAEVELILTAAPAGREAVNDRRLARVSEFGEARARAGVPIDDVLLAWRQGVQVLLDEAREAAEVLDISAEDLLGVVEALLAWSDRAMAVVAAAHRGEELALARQQQDTRGALVVGLLLGTLAPSDARARAEAQGLEVDRAYVAIRAPLPTDADRSPVERALGFHGTARPRAGLSSVIDGDLAGLLREPPGNGLPVAVGVGPPRPVDRLAESFALATRALATARAFDLVGVKTVDALGLLPAVLADAAVGEALCRRYIDPLPGTSGAEIAASLRVYFSAGMHVERAAERLFVHPNTLRYRIGRFEEATGANLRDPLTAFEVWWALQRAAVRA